jgi:hypothetical protein
VLAWSTLSSPLCRDEEGENGAWHVRRYESAVVVLGPLIFRDADSLSNNEVRTAVGVAGGLSIIISRWIRKQVRIRSIMERDGSHYRASAGPQPFRPDLTTYMLRSNAVQCSSSLCVQKIHDTLNFGITGGDQIVMVSQ